MLTYAIYMRCPDTIQQSPYLTIYVNEHLKSGQSVPIDKKYFAKYDRIPTDFME